MPAPSPALCFVPTADRWGLALHRYRQPDPAAPAVILCAGFGCNRHFIDYDDRTSLARYLASQGFDTWVVELRGRGKSQALRGCRRPNSWTFDDLARVDAPTVIRFVRHEIGHRRLCWVGHSMGGMVLYAHLGTADDDALPAAAVTLASPVVFPRYASELVHRLGAFLLRIPFPERVPQRAVLGAMWHLVGWTSQIEIGMNPENVDRALVGRVLRRSLCNVAREKLRQLQQWSQNGSFASFDGSVDYRRNLGRVRTPVLVVAGARDRLVPPDSARVAYELLASPRKRFVEVGRAEGFSADYGHLDLVLGLRVAGEVYPVIADWTREVLAEA
jgi:predicted alpha/beta hydrolase